MIPSPYEDNLLMDPREKIYSQAPIGPPVHLPASTQMFIPILSAHKNEDEWLSKRFRGRM